MAVEQEKVVRYLNLIDEERLTEKIREYPVLYDKRHKGHMSSLKLPDIWKEIAKELDFVENGAQAQHMFENFKKRYLKKRNSVRTAQRNNSPLDVIERARAGFEPYSFFTWYERFMRVRGPKKQKVATQMDFNEDEFAGEGIDDDDIVYIIKREDNTPPVTPFSSHAPHATSHAPHITTHTPCVTVNTPMFTNTPTFVNTPTFTQPSNSENTVEMSSEDDSSETITYKETLVEPSKPASNSESLFGKMIADELRKFSEKERYQIKHEINDVLFRHAMNRLSKPPSNPTIAHYSNNSQLNPSYLA